MKTKADDPRGLSPAEAATVDVSAGETRDAADDDGEASGLHDSFDDVLREVVRGGPTALGLGSELAGRFLITRVLGQGGMGTVYVARDTSLGREVAIKVHHSAGGAHRLRREAVAMAMLAHPNVVTVFEVGELAGRPFVVMEYVPGTTLRAWLAAAPRPVPEILAMLLAAGEGLAAAHDAGLVHRDVKPENVLIGGDGRARVGDFGLARESDSREEPVATPSHDPDSLLTPVTQTGAVLGTPAYMAPEQFAGEPVDARADQFAFCVTMWEALWKERPFVGASFEQLHTAITRGARRPPPPSPKVPPRVRRAIERGLSVAPEARFPTMHALLAAMRPPRRRRARWAIGGALALAAATGVGWAALGGDDRPSCDHAGFAELVALRRDFGPAIAASGATKLAARVEAAEGMYRAGFRTEAQRACEMSRAREWSPEIAAKAQLCFAITARTAALQLATADPSQPADVLRRIRRLPPVEHCLNLTHLAARPPSPRDAAQVGALVDATATLAVGFDAIDRHALAELRSALAQLAAAPARTDPGIAAGATVLRGWLAYTDGQLGAARTAFTDAYFAARAIDDERVASVALGLLVGEGRGLGMEPAAISDWLRTALADADRIRARSPWLAGRLYGVAAQAAESAGDAPSALAHAARAREVLGPSDPSQIETYVVEGAVLMWSGKPDDGVRAYETALAKAIAYFGDDDPEVAAVLSNYASSLLDVERLVDALRTAERAADIIQRTVEPDDDRIDPVRVTLAAVLISANHEDDARALLEAARKSYVRRLGEHSLPVANIDSNLANIYNAHGEHDRAIAALEAALATDEKLLGPVHLDVAAVLYNLAVSHRARRAYPAALAAARRAAAINAEKSPGSDRHRLTLALSAAIANDARDYATALELTATALGFARPAEGPQTRPWALVERSIALIHTGRAREARPLLTEARAAYVSLAMTQRVQQIDGLLARAPR